MALDFRIGTDSPSAPGPGGALEQRLLLDETKRSSMEREIKLASRIFESKLPITAIKTNANHHFLLFVKIQRRQSCLALQDSAVGFASD
jgi:hypothetical protein